MHRCVLVVRFDGPSATALSLGLGFLSMGSGFAETREPGCLVGMAGVSHRCAPAAVQSGRPEASSRSWTFPTAVSSGLRTLRVPTAISLPVTILHPRRDGTLDAGLRHHQVER